MPLYLPPFDPSRDLVCQTRFLAGGRWFAKGDDFDKSLVNARVLGRLYDQRKVYYSDGEQPQKKSRPRTLKANLTDLLGSFVGSVAAHARSVVGLDPDEREVRINALVNRNTRDQLVELADGLDYPEGATKAVIAGALVDAGRDGSS